MKVLWVSGEQPEQSRAERRAWGGGGGTGLAGRLSQDFGQSWTERIFSETALRTDRQTGRDWGSGWSWYNERWWQADEEQVGLRQKQWQVWKVNECVCARQWFPMLSQNANKAATFPWFDLRRITKATKKESLYHRTMLRGFELFCPATSVNSQSKQNNKTVSLFNHLIQSSVWLLNHLLFIVY